MALFKVEKTTQPPAENDEWPWWFNPKTASQAQCTNVIFDLHPTGRALNLDLRNTSCGDCLMLQQKSMRCTRFSRFIHGSSTYVKKKWPGCAEWENGEEE